MDQTRPTSQTEAPPMAIYGIGYQRSNQPRPYYIVENGTRLPIAFCTIEAAQEQIQFLKAAQTGTSEPCEPIK